MIATVISDVALFVTAVAALLVAISLLMALRLGVKRFTVKLKNIEVSVDGVNRAVNCVPPGTPPLTARVGRIEKTLDAIVEHLGLNTATLD